MRVASPPIRYPCFMGVDMASQDELIAAHQSTDEIARHIGVDSLAYLSLEGCGAPCQKTARVTARPVSTVITRSRSR